MPKPDSHDAENLADEPVASIRSVYDGKLFPDEQIRTFRNIDRLFSTRTIARAGAVRPLPRRATPLRDLSFVSGGKTCDLYDYYSRNRLTGLLMMKDGEIAFERYEAGNTERTRWMSMSMAKSFATTLVGAAIKDGYIGGLEDPLDRYVPELKGGGYEGVSVRALLQMTSGVEWYEGYEDRASDRRRMLELQIEQKPGAILDLMASRPRAAEPGTVWNYSTGETHIVGALVHAATGRYLSDYLSEKIWSRLGMESDAAWWLEAPGGLEVAGSGMCATLRDYARFGLFMMNDGVIDGERVLPEGWVAEAGAPRMVGGKQVDYGFMWWPQPSSTGSFEDGAFRAGGIFGQYIYINPKEKVVVCVWSARSKPKFSEAIPDVDFFNAAVEALR